MEVIQSKFKTDLLRKISKSNLTYLEAFEIIKTDGYENYIGKKYIDFETGEEKEIIMARPMPFSNGARVQYIIDVRLSSIDACENRAKNEPYIIWHPMFILEIDTDFDFEYPEYVNFCLSIMELEKKIYDFAIKTHNITHITPIKETQYRMACKEAIRDNIDNGELSCRGAAFIKIGAIMRLKN